MPQLRIVSYEWDVMQITFRAESIGTNGDTFGIRVYRDLEPGPWIQWVDPLSGKCVTSDGIHCKPDGIPITIPVGWAGARSQAEMGAMRIQALYDSGRIK